MRFHKRTAPFPRTASQDLDEMWHAGSSKSVMRVGFQIVDPETVKIDLVQSMLREICRIEGTGSGIPQAHYNLARQKALCRRAHDQGRRAETKARAANSASNRCASKLSWSVIDVGRGKSAATEPEKQRRHWRGAACPGLTNQRIFRPLPRSSVPNCTRPSTNSSIIRDSSSSSIAKI